MNGYQRNEKKRRKSWLDRKNTARGRKTITKSTARGKAKQ